MKKNIFLNLVLIPLIFLFLPETYSAAGIVNMLSETDGGASFEINLQGLEFANVKDFQFKKIIIEGFGDINLTGLPGVVARGILVEVPPGCEVDMKAVSLEQTVIDDFLLAPSPRKVLEGE